jgi:hypothetical protein
MKYSEELKKYFPAMTKVRKNHRCRLCNGRISKGEECCSWTTFEEKPRTYYAHPECYQVTLDEGWDSTDWEVTFPGEDFDRPKGD